MREDSRKISVISRQSKKQLLYDFGRELDWVQADLNDTDSLMKACDGVDVVIHIAGIANSHNASREKLLNTNFVGTKNLFAASLKAGVKRFVFISSIHAATPDLSNYAYSKRAAEDYLISRASENAGVDIVILRAANVYGVGMSGNIATFIRLAKTGMLPLLPKRERSFELVSVKALCMTIIETLGAPIPGNTTLNYTVTDGNLYTASRIEDAVYDCLGSGKPKFQIPVFIFFLGTLVGHIINLIGLKKNQIGLGLFNTLYRTHRNEPTKEFARYSISGSYTFESELPSILASLNQK